ncbi:MAG: hypothetical protein DMG23_03375 [Acidobacteria bacterium]|nr:MAG: hypothetical protein DMG23_03375 [Acidobacteriota bacterium]
MSRSPLESREEPGRLRPRRRLLVPALPSLTAPAGVYPSRVLFEKGSSLFLFASPINPVLELD